MLWNMLKANQKNTGIKYKFGVRSSRTLQEALDIKYSEGTTYSEDSMEKETHIIAEEYNSFKENDEDLSDYQYITLLWAFTVKYNGRRRSKLVSGGHVKNDLQYDIYSGKFDLEIVRILERTI